MDLTYEREVAAGIEAATDHCFDEIGQVGIEVTPNGLTYGLDVSFDVECLAEDYALPHVVADALRDFAAVLNAAAESLSPL